MTKLIDPNDIVSASDIAAMLEVGRAAVSNWQKRDVDFPEPITVVSEGAINLWLRQDIVQWYRNRHAKIIQTLENL